MSAVIIDLRTRQPIERGAAPAQPLRALFAAQMNKIGEAGDQVRAIYGQQDRLAGALRWYRRHDDDKTPPSAA